MDYDLIVVKTLERVYKNYYYIIRGEKLTVTQAVEQYGLTRREDTILRNLMQGKENPVICEELTISTNTLKKHILNIYRKLGIRNRVQLFKMIREHEETV